MYTVYILKSEKDKRLYIGLTVDLERRMIEHSRGFVQSTSYRRPLVLVYKESFNTKKEAIQRERYFKGGGRARKLLGELMGA